MEQELLCKKNQKLQKQTKFCERDRRLRSRNEERKGMILRTKVREKLK